MFEILKFRRNWAKAKEPIKADRTKPVPPYVDKHGGACVLYLLEVAALTPTLRNLIFQKKVTAESTAMLLDTLNHSAITPPKPWPQVLHRFDTMVSLPSTDERGNAIWIPAFVFYPI